jgi:hypothetical protein
VQIGRPDSAEVVVLPYVEVIHALTLEDVSGIFVEQFRRFASPFGFSD